ncbi:hypothetical protein ACH4OX_24425 [Streptomyces roseolus]|uniref:hypothetical protein n=1 Tax=Streptomyces roseolus TaxID=67358 RepID=UPI003798FA7F
MTTYRIGERVRTTVDAPAGWTGAFSAPAGTLGRIVNGPTPWGEFYGVLLDGDPDNMPSSYSADELTHANEEDPR